MRRLLGFTIFVLALYLAGAGTASATTYYIANNGSDSNSGTSKTSPWLHAPGMASCSGNCSSTTPKAGDNFIFRGGDSWHTNSGTVGLPWVWNWNGSSGNPIYIGVDQSWFGGSSWGRPAFNMDNPLSTSKPSSCAHADDSITALAVGSHNFVTIDNFEFLGGCWSGNPSGHGYITNSANNLTIENSYFHGWTMTSGASGDSWYSILGSGGNSATLNSFHDNVFDGSDSSLGATQGEGTGFAMYQECYDVFRNVFTHITNGVVCADIHSVHDNIFDNMNEPVGDNPHGNVVESLGGINGATFYFYNNIVRHINEGVTIWAQFTTAYVFNNVFYDNGNPTNCLMQSPPGFNSGSGSASTNIYNNTFDGPCNIRFYGGNSTTPSWSGPVNIGNNHFIGYSGSSVSGVIGCDSGANCSTHDNGGELFQSESTANGQGYTAASNYAPSSGNGATVGAGTNLTSSCGTFSPDGALCSGLTSVKEAPGLLSGLLALFPGIPSVTRPTSGSWNAGAYQFGTGSSTQPNPPTGLTIIVQ